MSLLKLNLGCGFIKKIDYVNVDISEACQPDLVLDLVNQKWPWRDSTASAINIDCALEQMGHTVDHLKHFFRELYRVSSDKAEISIRCVHPRHDQFALNPLCTQKISPEFLSLLSASSNLSKIANGAHDDHLAIIWAVNFSITRHKYLLNLKFQKPIEMGEVSEEQMRERMLHENNICHFIEIDMVALKS